MADDLLVDLLNYDPTTDPTDLLSRAYNEIEGLRNLAARGPTGETPGHVTVIQAVDSAADDREITLQANTRYAYQEKVWLARQNIVDCPERSEHWPTVPGLPGTHMETGGTRPAIDDRHTRSA